MRTNFPSNLTTLVAQLRKIEKHGACAIIAKSDVGDRMTKKSRSTKLPPPDWSVGLYSLTRSVVSVNHVYEKTINNQLAKTGFTPNFEAAESTVSIPVAGWPNNILRESPKNPDQLYVRVFIEMGVKTSLEIIYINGLGQVVTDKVTQDFKDNFFPTNYGSEKQAMHGVSKEIKPREYKAENILYLQKGDIVFNNLSTDLYRLFNLEAIPA